MKIALILLLTAGGAALAVCWVCFFLIFHTTAKQRRDGPSLPTGAGYAEHRERMLQLVEDIRAIPYEDVWISAKDGIRLHGRYYHTADGAPLQIQVHGYRGSALRDFCGGCQLALEMGHNVLMVDQRAHGESGGSTIGFGLLERFDVQTWAQYAAARFPNSALLLCGISMGGTSVLMASNLPLPASVVGVFADCPFNSPAEIIQSVCRSVGLPSRLLWPPISLGARLFGGLRLNALCAARCAAESPLPIQLVHGEADRFVPCGMSREIADACGSRCSLALFPGAAHGMSFVVDLARYRAVMQEFCGRVLPPKDQ